MKAKVVETGEIVNVTPYPTWYKENGQGPDRREWDEDEVKLRADINKLLLEFSKKYDVECIDIGIARNEWYGRNTYECPMYLLSLAWKFDYLAHEKE